MDKKTKKTETKSSVGGTNFLISIHQQEGNSWQGVVQWLETGEKVHFRSALELISLMDQAVATEKKTSETKRTWQGKSATKIG